MRRSVAIIGTRGYPSYYGGFETAVRRLAPVLVDRGWDVTVYGRGGSTDPNDVDRDYRVVSRNTAGIDSRSLSTLTYGLTSTVDAARSRPDVALVMNVANGFWLPLLKSRGIPTVVNVDGIEWEREKWSRMGKAVFRTGATWTARHADRLVYDAHAIAARWERQFGTFGDFIPYGGDVIDELPVEPGLTHRKYVLVVARFVPENTIGEFFDAAEKLGQDHDVVIVGSSGYGGELDERAEALAAKYKRISWLGHIHDDVRLNSLWQHAGAYFHGHSVGGTNPALVQAIACGAPIVARDTEFNREVLGERTGLFTDPLASSIYTRIDTLMRDPQLQSTLSERALQRVHDGYTWEAVCDSYERSLLEAIKKRPTRKSKGALPDGH